MRIRLLLAVTAVLMVGFGLSFLLAPARVFALYGVTLTKSGVMLAHVAGAAVSALGVLALSAREVIDERELRRTLLPLAVFFVVKSTVSLIAQVEGVFNSLGWTILLIDVPLAVLFVGTLVRGRRKNG